MEHAFALFNFPESQRLANLSGVLADLFETSLLCDRWIEAMRREPKDPELAAVLCCAAVVRYGRTFSSSVRKGVPDLIEKLPPRLREVHAFIKDARDKWIAHSVNTFEETSIKLHLAPDASGVPRPIAVAIEHDILMSLPRDRAEGLKELASELGKLLYEESNKEQARVLEFAQSLSSFQLYVDPGSPARLALGDPSKGRKPFVKRDA